MSAQLPSSVTLYMRRYLRRRRLHVMLRATGLSLALFLLLILCFCLLDRLARLPSPVRLVFFLVTCLAPLSIIIWTLRRILLTRFESVAVAAEIERHRPAFGGRLLTVVSQFSTRPEHRGSPAMLHQLLSDVQQQVAARQDEPSLSWKPILRPWLVTLGLSASFFLLRMVPWMDLNVLLTRLALPLAHVPPVTTTRISVEPRTVSLMRGGTLVVRANVDHLPAGSSVDIFTSPEGRTDVDANNWSRIQMLPISESEFVFTLPSMQRGIRYYVAAGDAASEVYEATVLKPPAIAEWRLRLEYPAYTGRPPVTLSNTDGIVEALVGTKVTASLVATEPLRSAVLNMGGQKIPLQATQESRVLQAIFPITKSETAELQMTSGGGLDSRVKQALTVRAQTDREPLARMLQPSDDLRLGARDLLPIQYQAMDDYGLTGMELTVQVNAEAKKAFPITRTGDPRRQEGSVTLDLGALKLNVGDALSIGLTAIDGAGHRITRDTRHILISPRSVDLNTHVRIDELKQGAQFAAALKSEVESANLSIERARKSDGSEIERLGQRLSMSRSLASGAEAGLLLHQSLLRAIARSGSPSQTLALCDLLDKTRSLTVTIDHVSSLDAGSSDDALLAKTLQPALEDARALAAAILVQSQGEQAAAVLADRVNLSAPVTRPADRASADRIKETIRRAKQDVAAEVQELGLRPDAAQLESQLKRMVEMKHSMESGAVTVDFVAPAARWAETLRRRQTDLPPFSERLISASMAEAVRPDTDATRARDLQLAARASEKLADLLSRDPSDAGALSALDELPQVMTRLAGEHALTRRPRDVVPPEQLKEIRNAAGDARNKLAQWAQQADLALAALDRLMDLTPEDLALEGSSQTAQHNFDAARRADQRLARRVPADESPFLQHLPLDLRRVEQIDDASAKQEDLRDRTARAGTVQDAEQLSSEQKKFAQKLGDIPSGDADLLNPNDADLTARESVAASLQAVQEHLAQLPQELARGIEAADAYRLASMRNTQARRELAAADATKLPAAQRAVEQTAMVLRETTEQLDQMTAPLAPEALDSSIRDLKQHEDETHDAVAVLDDVLQPALQVLQQAMRAGERAAVDRGAQRVREALETAQTQLRATQVRLIERDPLAAARHFAEAAARALDERPPDFKKAQSNQSTASLALSRAWQSAMRQSTFDRLASTSSFRAIVLPQPPPAKPSSSPLRMQNLSDWTGLSMRTPDALATPSRDGDPPAYQESLKVYFETLSKLQDAPAATRP